MKRRLILFTGMFLLLSGSFLSCSRDNRDTVPEHSLTIYYSADVSDLVQGWAAVYRTRNPDVEIRLKDIEGSSADTKQHNQLFLVSDRYGIDEFDQAPWKEVIGREIVVPVINVNNPLREKLTEKGVSPEMLKQAFTGRGDPDWGQVLGEGEHLPMRIFMTDAAIPEMAGFLNTSPAGMKGTRVNSGDKLIAAVQGEISSIGLTRVVNLRGDTEQDQQSEVILLPIDENGNGTIDFKEDIYSSTDLFTRSAWLGKYPRELINNIYSVSAVSPDEPEEAAFLKWILAGGQALLDNYGISRLEQNERLARINQIDNLYIVAPSQVEYQARNEPIYTRLYFLVVLTFMAIVLLLTISGLIVREKPEESEEPEKSPGYALNERSVLSPQGLYYDRTHTWLFMDEDGKVRIGIDDFLQRITGTLTSIKVKKAGERIRKGKQVLSIVQEGKQLDICSPVSGNIVEVNESLFNNAALMNDSPYSEGWVYKIEPTNWIKDIEGFFMVSTYKEWLKTEIVRLKDFIMESVKPETMKYAHVLQDGGELKENILKEFGPEIWEDFQTNFMNVPS